MDAGAPAVSDAGGAEWVRRYPGTLRSFQALYELPGRANLFLSGRERTGAPDSGISTGAGASSCRGVSGAVYQQDNANCDYKRDQTLREGSPEGKKKPHVSATIPGREGTASGA